MGHIKIGYRSRMTAWLPRGYPQSVLKNGIGRFVVQLQRLTLNFCRTRYDSFGIRQFIEHDLLNFANANPGVVLYLRPIHMKSPYLIGEYLNGRRASVHVSNFDRAEVNRWVSYLRTRSGQRIVHFKVPQRTPYPSIQGFWNPFTNVPTDRNIIQYPNHEIGLYAPTDLTATERLLAMIKEKQPGNVQIIEENETEDEPQQ